MKFMTLNCKLLTFLLIIKWNYSQGLKIRYFYSLLNAACTSQKLIDKIYIYIYNKIFLYEKVSLLKQEISELQIYKNCTSLLYGPTTLIECLSSVSPVLVGLRFFLVLL